MDFAEVKLTPLFRGDPRTIVFNVTDPDGDPINLAGSSWSSTIREFTTASFGQSLSINVSQASVGVLTTTITGEQSRVLKRRFVGDLQGSSLFGTMVRFYAEVLSDATRGEEEPSEGLVEVINLVWGGVSATELTSTVRAVLLGADAAGTYTHTQSAASASWVVNHALGYFPNVSLTDENGNTLWGNIIHHSPNQLEAQFNTARTGIARLS